MVLCVDELLIALYRRGPPHVERRERHGRLLDHRPDALRYRAQIAGAAPANVPKVAAHPRHVVRVAAEPPVRVRDLDRRPHEPKVVRDRLVLEDRLERQVGRLVVPATQPVGQHAHLLGRVAAGDVRVDCQRNALHGKVPHLGYYGREAPEGRIDEPCHGPARAAGLLGIAGQWRSAAEGRRCRTGPRPAGGEGGRGAGGALTPGQGGPRRRGGYGAPAAMFQIVATPIAAQAAPIPIASKRKRPSRSNAGGSGGRRFIRFRRAVQGRREGERRGGGRAGGRQGGCAVRAAC